MHISLTTFSDNKTDEVDFGCNVFLDGYLWYLEKLKSERKSGPKVHLVCRDEKHFQRICTTFDYFVEESLASHTEGLHSSVKEVILFILNQGLF